MTLPDHLRARLDPPTTLRVVSRPVHPDALDAADRALEELIADHNQRREQVISALATEAVAGHRPDMLGALHIVEQGGPATALVDRATARNADMVTLRIETPCPTLASFWPWIPGTAPDRIATLSELVA